MQILSHQTEDQPRLCPSYSTFDCQSEIVVLGPDLGQALHNYINISLY